MKARATLAALLLEASGHVGALGPVLAAACARAAEALADAALALSPLAECPGCGALAPTVGAEAGAVCHDCEEREADAPPVHPPGDFEPAWFEVAGGPRVNVAAYHHRAAKPEEPS